jgi:PPOX class probable F420-dependent enzyme
LNHHRTLSGGLDDRIRRFLTRQRVAHFATADSGGAPHVVPICFALVGERVYVALDEKPKRLTDLTRLRRVRNLIENPRVAIVVDVYDDHDWSRLGFALLRGRARLLLADQVDVSGDERSTALAALRARYEQYRSMALEERPIIAVDIERVGSWGNLDAEPKRGG